MLPEPPNGYLPEYTVRNTLLDYIYAGEFPKRMPKRISPLHANQFLEKFLDRRQPSLVQIIKIGKLMRFYDLRTCATKLVPLLDGNEKGTSGFERSKAVIELLCDLGTTELQYTAMDYFKHSIIPGLGRHLYEQQISLLFHLPEDADPKWISDMISAQMKELESQIEVSPDSAVTYYKLREMIDSRMARVLRAKQRKHQILNISDIRRQLLELIIVYLELEYYGYVDMKVWAVMMLQRRCNETDAAFLAEVFQHGLNLIMSRARARGKLAPGDVKDLKKYVTRCARAIEFYGGELNKQQQKFVNEHMNDWQNDILFWEPTSV